MVQVEVDYAVPAECTVGTNPVAAAASTRPENFLTAPRTAPHPNPASANHLFDLVTFGPVRAWLLESGSESRRLGGAEKHWQWVYNL
jgi:hypothetical protein